LELIRAAAEAGADAVKLQTYTADTITIDYDGPGFRIAGGLWDGRTLHDLYEEAHTPWDWHAALFEEGRRCGVAVFSSPFDPSAVEFLETLNAPAYKIASFEVTDLPLIRRVAAAGKPMIISTGMASESEIAEAVGTAREGGCREILLLHCVSGYPTPAREANLLRLPELAKRFDVPVGLSDHTLGIEVPIAAVALGAVAIEKHVTLARAAGGPDAAFSLEPGELRQMIGGVRTAAAARGSARYERQPSELGNVQFRRSLYVVADVARGETLTERNVRSIRPGFGLPPKLLPDVVGKRAVRPLKRGEPLSAEMIEDGATLFQSKPST
jgi:N-acetylneuraminate synthase